MTIEEARDYWSKRLERAESYSVEHLDADERCAYADYIGALQHAITALAMRREYEEAEPARWTDNGEDKWICSACKGYVWRWFGKQDFCPNCGARMDVTMR